MPPEVTPIATESAADSAAADGRAPDSVPAKDGDLLAGVANALGAAWSTFQLYPDPRGRIGFEQALHDLEAAPVVECVAVGPHGFSHEGVEVKSSHDGAGRLAERMFATGIAAVEFDDDPMGDDLVALFEIICRTRDELDEEGGPAAVLKARGAHTLRIIEQQALIEQEGSRSEDRPTGGVFNPLDFAGDPEALAAALIEAAGGDPEALAALVVRAYERAHFLIDPADVRDREEIVHTFVDTFFQLPEVFQAPTISEMLARHREEPFRTFLDQFSAHEVRALAPLLDADTHPLLAEYAAIASRTTDRPDELTELIDEIAGGHPIDDVVTRRIEAILNPGASLGDSLTGGAFSRLAGQKPDRSRHRDTGIRVLQGLLRAEVSDHDRRRLIRIWSGKVVDAIRHHDAEAAHAWLDAAPNDLSSDADRAEAGLGRAINLEVAANVVAIVDAGPKREENWRLLERLASHVLGHVVELLGKEPDGSRRRQLIEVATRAARVDPQPIVTRLGDPRWYLVRNLALILGRSHHPHVTPQLRRLCAHPDERVRREAIRAIHTLAHDDDLAPFVEALWDPSATVRKAAGTILRSVARTDFIDDLERILFRSTDDAVKLDVIELLGAIETPDAEVVLAKVKAGAVGRGLRGAARTALEQR